MKKVATTSIRIGFAHLQHHQVVPVRGRDVQSGIAVALFSLVYDVWVGRCFVKSRQGKSCGLERVRCEQVLVAIILSEDVENGLYCILPWLCHCTSEMCCELLPTSKSRDRCHIATNDNALTTFSHYDYVICMTAFPMFPNAFAHLAQAALWRSLRSVL